MPNIKARIVNKHDTEYNWGLAVNFIPLAGEIIVYDTDSTHAYPRFKVGDGETVVGNLPFSTVDYMTEEEVDALFLPELNVTNKLNGALLNGSHTYTTSGAAIQSIQMTSSDYTGVPDEGYSGAYSNDFLTEWFVKINGSTVTVDPSVETGSIGDVADAGKLNGTAVFTITGDDNATTTPASGWHIVIDDGEL